MGNIKDRDRKLERQKTAAQIGFEDELRTSSKKNGYEIPHLIREQDYPLWIGNDKQLAGWGLKDKQVW